MVIGSNRRVGKEPVIEVSKVYPEGFSSQYYKHKASVPYPPLVIRTLFPPVLGYYSVLYNTFVKPLELNFSFIF